MRSHDSDRGETYATAIAVDQGRIFAISSEADFSSLVSNSDFLDVGGRAIIPGLTDSHIHLESYALSTHKIDCETPTRQECLKRVALVARTKQPGEWVHGHGWNQNVWGGWPTASELDAVAPNNPVFDLPVIVGIEEGLFAEAGLDVSFSATYADREKDNADKPVMFRLKLNRRRSPFAVVALSFAMAILTSCARSNRS